MVRVNTNLLLGGHYEAGSIVIPSSPQLPSFQHRRSESPDAVSPIRDRMSAATGAVANNVEDPNAFILVPSTPESSPLPAAEKRGQRASENNRGSPADRQPRQKQPDYIDDWTFPGVSEQPDHANSTTAVEDAVVGAIPAVQRRRDWTPPPADTIILNSSDSSAAAAEAWSSPRKSTAMNKPIENFKSLRDDFTCKDDDASTTNDTARPVGNKEDAFTARRAIEMVPVNGGGPSPVKTRAPKRKARTITELAVAAYVTPSSADDGARAQVTAKKGRVATGRAKDAVINPGLPLTKARKGIKARPKEKVKRGKNAAPAGQAVLLSPQSALAESSAQDFVFGTSSQLAGDESPTFLRALHTALRSSNQHEQDPDIFAGVGSVDLSSRAATAIATRPRLWTVGARIDGKLAFDNVVDLEDDISFPEDPEAIVLAQRAAEARMQKELETAVSEQPNEPPKARLQPDKVVNKEPPVMPPPESRGPVTASPPREVDRLPGPDQGTAQTETARPNFEMLTTTQLAAQVASFGYKPIRERKAMVSLLGQCWEAKNQPLSRALHTLTREVAAAPSSVSKAKSGAKRKKTAATTAVPNDAHPSATAIPPDTGKAGRPRTPRSRAKPLVFEIEDSESDGRLSSSPEPPSSPASHDGLSMDSTDDEDMSLAAGLTGEESELFALITTTVTTMPRTHDPSNPSWHEKILMYDTIILEPFTAWLNDGPLSGVGYTDTVTALQVKKWCESKSVCCTWLCTQRGTERKL